MGRQTSPQGFRRHEYLRRLVKERDTEPKIDEQLVIDPVSRGTCWVLVGAVTGRQGRGNNVWRKAEVGASRRWCDAWRVPGTVKGSRHTHQSWLRVCQGGVWKTSPPAPLLCLRLCTRWREAYLIKSSNYIPRHGTLELFSFPIKEKMFTDAFYSTKSLELSVHVSNFPYVINQAECFCLFFNVHSNSLGGVYIF